MYLTKKEVLKKINGNPDAAAEFVLSNYEIYFEDLDWALQEVNGIFNRHKLPMKVLDVHITAPQEILWKIQDLNVANSNELC